MKLVYTRRQGTVGIIDRLVVGGHTQRATPNNFIHHDALGGSRPRELEQY